MGLFDLLIGSGVAFAILSWLLIPVTKRRINHDRTLASISRAAMLAVFGFLRSASLIIMFTALTTIALIWLLGQAGMLSLGTLSGAVELAQTLRERLSWFNTFWSAAVILLLGAGLALHSWRRGRLRFDKAFEKKRGEELERLQVEFERGEWETLPPDPVMKEIDREAVKMRKLAEELAGQSPSGHVNALLHQIEVRGRELQQMRFAVDINRRMNLRLDPEAVELPPPTSRWQRFERFLFSEGLVASLGSGSRLLYLAALLLLVPSLLGVCSGSVKQSLDDRIVQLEDLRFDFRVEQTQKDWEEAKRGLISEAGQGEDSGSDGTNLDLTEDEEDAIDAFASVAEARFARSMFSDDLSWPTGNVRSLRATSVRQRILNTAARHAVSRLEVSPELSRSPHLSSAEREAVQVFEEARVNKPRTRFGKTVASELKELAARSPTVRQRLTTRLASFQKPARAETMAHSMARHAAGLVMDGGEGEIARVIEQALETTDARKSARQLSEVRTRQLLADVVSGKPVGDSLEKLSKPASFTTDAQTANLQAVRQRAGDLPQPNQILQQMRNYPPGIDSLPEEHVKLSKAGEHIDSTVRRLTPPGQRANGAQLADAVAQYRDWFPSYQGADRATQRGQLLEAWEADRTIRSQLDAIKAAEGPLPESVAGRNPNPPPADLGSGGGGGGGGGGSSKSSRTGSKGSASGAGRVASSSPRTPTVRRASFGSSASPSRVVRSSFLRARSFRGLRGFARVGGVLIGNEPRSSDDNTLDLRGLKWEVDGRHVTLILLGPDGSQYRSRRFRAEIAHQALAYAADGRPLAVTMVTATPLEELRILLHPALIDTPLGARVIAIDRFVDEFTGSSDFRQGASRLVHESIRCYEYARAARLANARGEITSLLKYLAPEAGSVISADLEEADELISNSRYLLSLGIALNDVSSLKDSSKTPLKAKPEFFDQNLVDAMIAAATGAKTVDDFQTAFRSHFAGQLTAPLFAYGDTAQRDISAKIDKLIEWLKPAPEFEIWSGVREAGYALTTDELLGSSDERQSPLSFMLQVAFTSAPAFLDDEEEAEAYTDEAPWEFPSIGKSIHQIVLTKAKASQRHRTILHDVGEFTALQRFFRAALAGHLGTGFPLERLADLQQVCIEAAPAQRWRTLRWNSRDGALEAMLRAQLGRVENPSQLVQTANKLIEENSSIRATRTEAVENMVATAVAGRMPDADWLRRWNQTWKDADRQLEAWETGWLRQVKERPSTTTADSEPDGSRAIHWYTEAMQIRRALGLSVDDAQSVLESLLPLGSL